MLEMYIDWKVLLPHFLSLAAFPDQNDLRGVFLEAATDEVENTIH